MHVKFVIQECDSRMESCASVHMCAVGWESDGENKRFLKKVSVIGGNGFTRS